MSFPDDLVQDALSLLNKVRGDESNGRIRRGTNEVTKIIERGKAQLLFIGEDVTPPEITRHLPILAKEKNVAYIIVPSSKALGESAGIDVGAASVCIEDAGSASNELKSIVDRAKEFN